MDKNSEGKYTDQLYWENYYKNNKVEVDNITKVVGAYDEYWDILINSCKHNPTSIIEIGAYPGRYIAYLASKYNLLPTALDFNSDRKKIEESFRVMKVTEFDIIQADFLSYRTDKKYDLVISNGFIEHFENFNEVLNKHYEYLAPGGAMLIMIPNKRYLRKLYGYLVDYSNLKAHNLKSMRLQVFIDFAGRNNLHIKMLTYHGGFPFSVHQRLNIVQNCIYQIFRQFFKRINPIIKKYPNKYLSSGIIAIYSKA